MSDAATRNEDWLRTLHWDLPYNFTMFLSSIWYLGNTPQEALRKFMALPAWEAAPDNIRQQAAQFLKEGDS